MLQTCNYLLTNHVTNLMPSSHNNSKLSKKEKPIVLVYLPTSQLVTRNEQFWDLQCKANT